jgi:hypothetical protein
MAIADSRNLYKIFVLLKGQKIFLCDYVWRKRGKTKLKT